MSVIYFQGCLSSAPIAQQVERIHGKDEVASSNLAGGSRLKQVRSYGPAFLFSDIHKHAGGRKGGKTGADGNGEKRLVQEAEDQGNGKARAG